LVKLSTYAIPTYSYGLCNSMQGVGSQHRSAAG
jgi:hypothetical protein